MVKRRQQNWKHSVVEMSSKRVIKRVYNGEIPERHPRRMPMKRWSSNLINSTLNIIYYASINAFKRSCACT